MNKLNIWAIAFSFIITACSPSKKENSEKGMKTAKDNSGNTYSYVENDPMKLRIYELENGLKLYLSKNTNEPTFTSFITIKAGSTYDPSDNTGLAHYLEHLMFKGTPNLGTVNWEMEKPLLDQIEELYELHKNEPTAEGKKVLYKKIDSLSSEAAKYASPNEFDKAISSIGGKSTNAFTSNEVTAYMNIVPANEIEKWVMLERERFGNLVLRLFHTELETVYEEFNRGQDSDGRKAYAAMNEALFAGHPYGDQTTIGEPEHLKNPSMKNIRAYWKKYYVPNNMAICLSGDVDYENTVDLFKTHWGDMKASEDLKHPTFEKLAPMTEPKSVDLFGSDKEFITLAYRLDGKKSKDADYGELLANLLSNGKAGLIDLNLVQQQKILDAQAGADFMKDYGSLTVRATLREGQTMEEAEALILSQIEKVKKGEFEDETFNAIINNLRKNEIQSNESNWRVYKLLDAFISDIPWNEQTERLDRLDAIKKADLIKFANEKFGNNYAVIRKNLGEDTNIVKVEKPEITPIEMNTDTVSAYLAEFKSKESPDLKPVYIDFENDIKHGTVNGNITFDYIKNEDSELFNLIYIIEMGSNHDKIATLAFDYLPFLGTSKYSASELQLELYKNGLDFGVYSGTDRTYVVMGGLKKSTDKGIELLEHILAEAKPDTAAYQKFAEGELKRREDAKLEKGAIQYRFMPAYAKYGKINPFTNIISKDELLAIDPSALTKKVSEISSMEHRIFYYGNDEMDAMKGKLEKMHPKNESLTAIPASITLVEQETNENKIYFVNRVQVQTDLLFSSKEQKFDKEIIPVASWFNSYYGGGLSSVFFQEIREAKGLAYTAYCRFDTPNEPTKSHYFKGYIGTQPDKLNQALETAMELLTEMPLIDNQIEAARNSILKRIASDRKIKDQKYFFYLSNLKRGISYDNRKDTYDYIKTAKQDDLVNFFESKIKGNTYTLMIMGNKEDLDLESLKKYGTISEISLEELFGY